MKPGGKIGGLKIFQKKSKREDKNKMEGKKTKSCELKERLWDGGMVEGVNEHPTPRQNCLFDP